MSWPEGILNRLVRVQLSKPVKENGKLVYHLRIDNASPLILNGLAAVGTTSKADEIPRVLSGISVPPRKSMTISARRGSGQDIESEARGEIGGST